MNDRKLLEAAAKAAGIVIDKSPFNGGGRENTGFDVLGNAVLDWHNGTSWNPLTDDGDALRLKVRLHLIVGSYATYSSVSGTYTADGFEVPDETVAWHHETGGDAVAAERLAITRCAAAIGLAVAAAGLTPNVGGNAHDQAPR